LPPTKDDEKDVKKKIRAPKFAANNDEKDVKKRYALPKDVKKIYALQNKAIADTSESNYASYAETGKSINHPVDCCFYARISLADAREIRAPSVFVRLRALSVFIRKPKKE